MEPRRVMRAVAQHYGIDVGDLRLPARRVHPVGARWVAVVLLREQCGLTYRAIAVMLGCNVRTAWDAYQAARGGAPLPRRRGRDTTASAHMRRRVGDALLEIDHVPSARETKAWDVEAELRRAREDAQR